MFDRASVFLQNKKNIFVTLTNMMCLKGPFSTEKMYSVSGCEKIFDHGMCNNGSKHALCYLLFKTKDNLKASWKHLES